LLRIKEKLELHVEHNDSEMHAEQLIGQSKHNPLNKYFPTSHIEHNLLVENEHFLQLELEKQHSLTEVKE
jgi:hypothetical protein